MGGGGYRVGASGKLDDLLLAYRCPGVLGRHRRIKDNPESCVFFGTMVFGRTERAQVQSGDEMEASEPPMKRKSVRRSLPGLIVGEDALTGDEFGG